MKARHWAIILFLGLGIAKLPLEQHSTTTLRSAGALNAPTDLGLRENLGQMSFAASLGGLRSLVASITYLQAFAAFENVDWGKVDSLMTLTTRLQPNFSVYWDDAASRMGYDAASYFRYDESRPTLYRNRLYREHVARGWRWAARHACAVADRLSTHPSTRLARRPSLAQRRRARL
jgi:hypothetical protein